MLGGGFSTPQEVAVDGSGNVFVADWGNNAVKEMPPGCASSSCVTTLGGGFSNPYGVAVDGSGNVFVADHGNNAVKEIPFGCITSSLRQYVGQRLQPALWRCGGWERQRLRRRFRQQCGERDSGGRWQHPRICDINTLGGGFNQPLGVAVDGSGNVFVADTNNGAVKEIPLGCVTFRLRPHLGQRPQLSPRPYGGRERKRLRHRSLQ